MKPLLITQLVLCFLFECGSFAQPAADCPCKDILAEGIRDTYAINTQQEFLQVSERLLRMTDEQLEIESKNKEGSGKLSVVIKAVPIGIGGGVSTRTDRLKEIRKKLQDDQNFHLAESNYQDVAIAVVNDNLVSKWESCMGKWIDFLAKTSQKDGFMAEFEVLEENIVSIKLKWVRPTDASEEKIKIRSVDLINAIEAGTRKIEGGTMIGAGGTEQLLTWIDTTRDAIAVINTEGAGTARHVFAARKPVAVIDAEAQVQRWVIAMKGMSSKDRRDFLHSVMMFPDGIQLSGFQLATLLEGLEGGNRVSVLKAAFGLPAVQMLVTEEDVPLKVKWPLTPPEVEAVLAGLADKDRAAGAKALEAPGTFKSMRDQLNRLQQQQNRKHKK